MYGYGYGEYPKTEGLRFHFVWEMVFFCCSIDTLTEWKMILMNK